MCVQWKELKFEKKNMVKKVVQSDSDVGMNKRYGCSSTSSIALSVDDSKVVAAEVEVAEVAVAEASGEPGVAQFTTEGWRFRRLNGNDRVPVPSASRINLSAVLDCLCFVTKFGSSDDIAL
ncbi:hypothetical protein PF007_g27708 [Phytophthora fragariae]|uniref:Uncharacterized protein n=1 Tax=Phytophthora fragariae TaxID=53985 RepID=A0A6A3Q3L2_9STRA|nr:hypothetical protein PF007_g27708 [Phytophthora fragariae]